MPVYANALGDEYESPLHKVGGLMADAPDGGEAVSVWLDAVARAGLEAHAVDAPLPAALLPAGEDGFDRSAVGYAEGGDGRLWVLVRFQDRRGAVPTPWVSTQPYTPAVHGLELLQAMRGQVGTSVYAAARTAWAYGWDDGARELHRLRPRLQGLHDAAMHLIRATTPESDDVFSLGPDTPAETWKHVRLIEEEWKRRVLALAAGHPDPIDAKS